MVRKMVCPGLFTCTPIDPIDVFLAHDVSCVVRINAPDNYNTKALDQAQIRVHELEDEDEEIPSQSFIANVLNIILQEQGTVMLHSKRGIRATGLLLCIYLVAEEGFTATQSIAWMRMVQPGCIIGKQQHLVYDLWQNAHEFEQLKMCTADNKQGDGEPLAKDRAQRKQEPSSSTPRFSLGIAASSRESILAPKKEDDIAQPTVFPSKPPVFPSKLPVGEAHRSNLLDIERTQTSRTAQAWNRKSLLSKSKSGWMTSRGDFERPSAWKNR
jgi:hypothetical protein